MKKRIRASLAYIGRSQEWLAEQLGMSESTLKRRMANEGTWQLRELKKLRKIFRWETLEG